MDYQNQRQIDIGDFAPEFVLPDERGRKIFSRAPHLSGRFLLFLFVPNPADPAQQAMLREVASLDPDKEESGLLALGITRASPSDNLMTIASCGLSAKLLSDKDGTVFKKFGVGARPRAVLLDGNARIIAYPLPGAILGTARAEIEKHLTEETLIPAQAPILLIPAVLNLRECQSLIDLWERENVETGVATEASGAGGQEIDHAYKNRIDHQISDPETIRFVNNRLATRIVPEIKKAFNYETTRFEHLRIGCYGDDGGFFTAHRDNTKPATAHRKFALTMCLNDEYEGGYLRFPEFGRQRYRPPTGGAVVFSTSLLHEVLPVVSGRRFALITFFFGEAEYAQRKALYERTRAAQT